MHVLTTDSGGDLEGLQGDFSVLRLPVTFRIFNTPVSLAAYRAAAKLANDADLIHTYGYPVYFSDISAHMATRRGIPLVLDWAIDPRQTTPYRENVLARAMADMYFRIHGNSVFQRADAIVLNCEEFRTYLVRRRLIPSSEKLHVIPRGLDTSLFTPGPRRPELRYGSEFMILYVGRINEQKGLDILLKAFPGVLRDHPNTSLVVIGPCDNPDYMRSLEKYLYKCGGRVRFPFGTKGVPNDQLVDYYRAADVVAFPSRYESMGRVPAEAMACGTPVVGTPVGANADLIGKAGIAVERENAEGLANALRLMLSDTRLRKALGKNGVQLISETRSWKRNADQYEAMYQHLKGG